ncbi:MAG: hypothetical protein AB1634_03110 [Thermodesulfobacteriota bacterium]
MKRRVATAVALMMQLSTVASAPAASQTDIDRAWNKGLAWLMQSQQADGSWRSGPGLAVQATASAIQAFSQAGLKTGYTYLAGVAWLGNAEPASVDALARQTAALKLAGEEVTGLGSRLLAWRNPGKGWGTLAGHASSLPDTPLAMTAALDAKGKGYSSADISQALCAIMPAQILPSYLWGYVAAPFSVTEFPEPRLQGGAIIPTAYVTLALHRLNNDTSSDSGGVSRPHQATCFGGTYYASTVITTGVTGLLARRHADGGFGDDDTSQVMETALVYQVLRTIQPADPAIGPALDFLLGRQESAGSWQADAFHTALVLSALPAPTALTDTDKDGVPDGVEAVLGLNPALADSRCLATGECRTGTLPAATQLAAAEPPAAAPSLAAGPRPVAAAGDHQGDAPWPAGLGPPDLELFIAGSAIAADLLEGSLAGIFQPGSLQVFFPAPGADDTPEDGFRAILGRLAARVPELSGRTVLVHFRGLGGSYEGVVPVGRGEPLARMVVDERCQDPEADGVWLCPAGRLTEQIPDAGISEVAPSLHAGVSLPPAVAALTLDELAELDAAPISALAYGMAASRALLDEGLEDLSQGEVADLLAGRYRSSWQEIDRRLPDRPITICRLADGAQAAANLLFLGQPCDPEAPAPAGVAEEGLLVVASSTPEGVAQCLGTASAGGTVSQAGAEESISMPAGSLAVGPLPLLRQPAAGEGWGYVPIDGQGPPAVDDPAAGSYPYICTGWMQWRPDTLAADGDERLALLQEIRRRLADPEAMAGLGPAALPPEEAQDMGCPEVLP